MTQIHSPLLLQAQQAFHDNQLEQGLACIRKLHRSPSNRSVASLELEALMLFRQQDMKAAAAALGEAQVLARTEREKAVVHSELGNVLLAQGDKDAAISAFASSVQFDPSARSDPSRYLLMKLYFEGQQWEKFLPIADRLGSSDRYDVSARLMLVEHARLQQDRALMLSCIEALTEDLERLADRDLGKLIEYLTDLGDTARARQWLERVAQCRNDPPWLNVYRAKLALSDHHPGAAEAFLRPGTLSRLPPWLPLAGALNLRAKCVEKQQRHDEAFRDFCKSAELCREQAQSMEPIDWVKRYQQLDLGGIPAVSLPAPAHVPTFLLGFPRSGTTLLETILDTRDNVITLSEKPALEFVRRAFSSRLGKQYPQALGELGEQEVNLLRKVYFDIAAQYCDLSTLGPQGILLDKMPINTIHLPLILTLFPSAKIILAVRHPLDVCLSNFQQYYQLNNEMAFLTTLDDCVERYVQVFSLFEYYRENLEFDFQVFHYEGLIDNPEKELQALCEFMHLDFSESLLRFDQGATVKYISTPSREQVAKPLYRSSMGKWKDYAAAMAPYQAKLARFIELLGYQAVSVQ